LQSAVALARKLNGVAGLFKVGNQLFTSEGPRAIEKLSALGCEIFLDLKFHDIPNTVAHAVAAASRFNSVRLMTLHATGGIEMMRAARDAAGRDGSRPRLLGVTILTSLDGAALKRIGMGGPPRSRAVALARLAKQAGLDGVVASAHEIRAIRKACGPKFLIVVPGIRAKSAASDDQSRIATPEDAIRAGADYLVVGRPITAASDPRDAAVRINAEIEAASRRG
jgi:orotidine-5'-phosphate decarboxylase